MHKIILELITRYMRYKETPTWFKNIGFVSLIVAFVCGSLLGQHEYPLPEDVKIWIDKIGFAATGLALLAFQAVEPNNYKPQNPQ